jgi:endonuclease YncB( thermonuclease family)
MSVSFDQWRQAERRKFDTALRTLKKGRPRSRSPRRRWLRRPRWRLGRVKALYGLFVVLGLAALAWQPSPETALSRAMSGAYVLDGDTLRVGSESIRLQGIDAPELRQTCSDGWAAGEAARRALVALVARGTPSCMRVATDRYGRTVAICQVNGEDIGEAMVRQGMAWAYTTYSMRYAADEIRARFARVGVHARSCDSPAHWRAAHPH